MSAATNLYAPSPSVLAAGRLTLKVAASTKIWGGTMVALNASGYAVPASATAGLKVVGRAFMAGSYNVDNTAGIDGALTVEVELSKGVRGGQWFAYDIDSGSPLTQALLLTDVFVADDHTVGASESNSIVAGTFMGFVKDNTGANITTKAWIRFAH